jgi:predicted small lipoprotein YifL
MSSPKWFSRLMIVAVAFTLCGGPELMEAQQNAPQTQTQSTSDRQNVGTSPNNATPDPSKGPLQPTEELPNAPSASRQASASGEQSQNPERPLGAAAAQAPKPVGGAATRPAGAAIAPAKQHQVRSLLIKVGAIAAGAAALGAVYALSRGTSSVPPGANTATTATAAQTGH